MSATPFRCGAVAVLGRPNVGKSTLMNRLIGQKISITAPRPQTTRYAIRGIRSSLDWQVVFVDTPGFQTTHRSALNRAMNRSVSGALHEVDVVVLTCEAGRWGEQDRRVLALVEGAIPVLAVINKIDLLARRDVLLPFIDKLRGERDFAAIVPVCARTGQGVDELLAVLAPMMPEGPRRFGTDALTDRSERFLAAEFIREKLFRHLGAELPYGVAVEIERFEQEGSLRRIAASILVERASHKAMVIGRGGALLKSVGAEARRDLENLFGGKVFLETWVKVKSGWSDDDRVLRSLGHE